MGSISVAVKRHPLSLAHNRGYMQDAPVPVMIRIHLMLSHKTNNHHVPVRAETNMKFRTKLVEWKNKRTSEQFEQTNLP